MQDKLPTTLTAFIVAFIKERKWSFALLTFLHLAWSIDSTIQPYAFKLLTDKIIAYNDDRVHLWSIVGVPVIMIAGIWITTDLMFRLYDWRTAYTFPPFEASIRMKMFQYVQGHSYGFLLIGSMLIAWQHNIISSSEFVYLFYSSWNITVMTWISGMELPNFFKDEENL